MSAPALRGEPDDETPTDAGAANTPNMAATEDTVSGQLSRLLERFGMLEPAQLYTLLEGIEHESCHEPEEEATCARRWLNVAYAVAARDGTPEAHRAYVAALDRFLASTRPLVG